MEAEKVIMDCAMGIGEEFYGLCSGGKDSMTACEIAHNYKPLNAIVTIDTTIAAELGDGTKPAIEAAKKFANRLGIPHIIIYPIQDYATLVKKYGFPHPAQHKISFIHLKWKAMHAFAKTKKTSNGKRKNIVFISGVRKLESKRRFGTAMPIQIDPTDKYMRFAAPIVYWDNEETISYCRKRKFELSTCYNTIMMSGDCLCGAYAQKGESALIKKFYPVTAQKIAELEKVAYKGHKGKNGWGNGDSMTGTMQQQELENFICSDCNIHRRNGD